MSAALSLRLQAREYRAEAEYYDAYGTSEADAEMAQLLYNRAAAAERAAARIEEREKRENINQ